MPTIYLQWKMQSELPSDFSHFNVYQAVSCSAAFTKIGEADSSTDSEDYYNYTVSGDGGDCFRISAEDTFGNESIQSICVCYYDIADYLCRVYTYLVDAEGNAVKVEGLARITSLPEDLVGKFWSGQEVAKYSDKDTGLVYWDLPRGSKINFIIYDMKIDISVTIPDLPSKYLNDFIE